MTAVRDLLRVMLAFPGSELVELHADDLAGHAISYGCGGYEVFPLSGKVPEGGPRLDPSNLRAACAACNVAKRNSEVAARARGDSPPPHGQWCSIHERPLSQCEHLEQWSERWY